MSTIEKVAIFTGAGTGIGARTALALLKEGYCVVLAGRRMAPLESTVAEAGSSGSRSFPVSTDISAPDSVRSLFARTKEKFGRLDLLFNNAGIGPPRALLEDLSYAQWQAAVDINLTGGFLCTQQAF